jgi:hypothetical protein
MRTTYVPLRQDLGPFGSGTFVSAAATLSTPMMTTTLTGRDQTRKGPPTKGASQ